ncbi:MAG: sigma-70 family RNA polymerase sigma factor [Candidatus Pacebacteria bacterium]|nr:sigma-70 family RNA polymerase sigma factor [Candidatus Paceibacterota bacterium]
MKDRSTIEKQFLSLYDKYSDDIFRFCLVKTKDRALSLDITQETFTKFWELLLKGSGSKIEQKRAYLYKIARNLIIDQSRKKSSYLVEDFTESIYESLLQEDPYERLQNKIDGEKALLLLNELPDSTKDLITLRYVEGLSIQEIAKITKKEPQTVSVYIHRGIKKMREILKEHEQR